MIIHDHPKESGLNGLKMLAETPGRAWQLATHWSIVQGVSVFGVLIDQNLRFWVVKMEPFQLAANNMEQNRSTKNHCVPFPVPH
jgi:hypothetical protein